MTTKQLIHFGTIISGTLRDDDLYPEFLRELQSLNPSRAAEYPETWPGDNPDWDYISDLMDDIDSSIEEPFVYFGSHEGDGADFGYWVAWNALDDAIRYGEIVQIEAGQDWYVSDDDGQIFLGDPDSNRITPVANSAGAEYVLAVNDHGNATLYALDGSEIWSVV